MSSTNGPRSQGRAEQAAALIEELAGEVRAGERLGTKASLRAIADVSVGTFNEAVRLLQARGVVTVRPGPGGGLFVNQQSPMVRLGNSVLALDSDVVDAVRQAVRIRDALDPLLIEDAIHHASPAQIQGMRKILENMKDAAAKAWATDFVHANWNLHRSIADVSPDTVVASIYCSLLELIETRTLEVLPLRGEPLPEYLHERYELHRDLVESISERDHSRAMELIYAHNTTMKRDENHVVRLAASS